MTWKTGQQSESGQLALDGSAVPMVTVAKAPEPVASTSPVAAITATAGTPPGPLPTPGRRDTITVPTGSTPPSTEPAAGETTSGPGPEPTATPTTDPPVQPDPTLVRQDSGNVELRFVTGYDSADIDNWHAGQRTDNDLIATEDALLTTGGANLVILAQGEPDHPTCRGLRDSGTERVPYSSLANGTYLCARSSDGRTAWLQIATLPTADRQMVAFYAFTWNDPT
jgi:hypothetical protein